VLLAGAVLAAVPGCGKEEAPKKLASAGSVKIVGLAPETTAALRVGEKVRVRVEVSFRLAAESGVVALVVQADGAVIGADRQAVRRGEGKAALAAEFVVPRTKEIQVFTPLQATGQKTTTTADMRTYSVAAK
jgi:hypothetical protein